MDYLSEMRSSFKHLPEIKFYVFENIADDNLKSLFRLMLLRYYNMYNIRSKYLFVGKGFSPSYLKFLKKIYIMNAVFLDVTSGLIYRSYGQQFFDDRQLIGDCRKINTISDKLFPQNANNFQTKHISLKFDNIPMYSCDTCQWKGIELELFELIFNHMGINYTFTKTDKFQGDLLGEIFDIHIGSKVLLNVYQTDYTVSYIEDYMKWFVPVDQKLARWRYILYVFNITIWIAWVASMTLLAVCWILLQTVIKHEPVSLTKLNVFNYLLIAFLGRGKKFRKLRTPQEFLIFSIIFLSFMINCFFSTRMTYLLNGINYEEGIESTEDIARHSLIVAGSSDFMMKMIKNIPVFEKYPKHYFTQCFNTYICKEKFKLYKRIAIFSLSKQRRYLEHDEIEKNFTFHLKELPGSYYTARIVAYIAKGHPMSRFINRQIVYAVEAGIVNKITEKYITKSEQESTSEPTESLTFDHILAPISFLIIGLTLSTLTFLLERRNNCRIMQNTKFRKIHQL
ncbi:hypothetical protein WA026_012103 [Henosepilachna vigintioctopunctata]|uniref:Ionotropic receptor n=1 Tax=Henosepilachna vigintioctopunctata TaxID=420089 RepID=A0AAW1V4Y7_9CUCU